MKTIQSYILERLILDKQGKLQKTIDLIVAVLSIEEYCKQPESEDNLNDIIEGIKEGISLAKITDPYFFTIRYYYDEISDYNINVKHITPMSDDDYYKFCQKINYKNAERVFESTDDYGLNIYANEYGINFTFYQESIFVIDQNSKIIDNIDK